MQQNTENQDHINENIRAIAGISAVLTGIMFIVYAALGRLSLPVLVGGAIGFAAGITNRVLLARAVRQALSIEEAQLASQQMRASYTSRMFLLAGAGVAAFLIPWADGIACLIALVFPRAAVRIVQFLENRRAKKQ